LTCNTNQIKIFSANEPLFILHKLRNNIVIYITFHWVSINLFYQTDKKEYLILFTSNRTLKITPESKDPCRRQSSPVQCGEKLPNL